MDSLRNARANVGPPAPRTYKTSDNQTPSGSRSGGQERSVHFAELFRKKAKPSLDPLAATEKNESSADVGASCDPARNLAQWFRAETPPEPAIAPTRPAPKIAPHQRVLVSNDGATAHARIQIAAGTLAGSQIQLTAAGNRIEAQLLTGNEASRQTLVAAMDAVRGNLRARGVLVAGARSVNRFTDARLSDDADGSENRPSDPRGPHGGGAER